MRDEAKEDMSYCLRTDMKDGKQIELKHPKDNHTYVCDTCKKKLGSGTMPAMAVANNLKLFCDEDRPKLSELENNLIAKNINFQQIVILHKSQWPAGKGKMISVPIRPEDIINTVKQLPRLPKDAGLIPVNLKRKKQYKKADKRMTGMIRPEIIFQALQYFRKHNHPSYNFFDTKEDYMARLRAKDQRGSILITGEDIIDEVEDSQVGVLIPSEVQDEINGNDEDDMADLEIELEKEQEDIQNDPIRRQHFDYARFSCAVNAQPEMFLNEDGNQITDVDFAPGEGKIPQNFLDQKNWDINSWPSLHPDGQFGMDHDRDVPLSSQKYFQQRILNKDSRFAKTPGYIFAAMSYVEAERLRSNANLSGYQGKKIEHEDGQVSYSLKDPFSVLAGIPGTPKYWQRVKQNMIAKLKNLGPFHWFFTLSCGDLRYINFAFSNFFRTNLRCIKI